MAGEGISNEAGLAENGGPGGELAGVAQEVWPLVRSCRINGLI